MFASRRIAIMGGKKAPFAVDFDGTDDYIEVSSEPYSSLTGNGIGHGYYDTLDSPFAVSLWVNIDEQYSNRIFISKGFFQVGAGANKGWGFGFTDAAADRIIFDCYTGTSPYYRLNNGATNGVTMNIDEADIVGKWMHLAATRTTHDADGTPNPSGVDSHYNVYINGVQGTTVVGVDGGTAVQDAFAADGVISDATNNLKCGIDTNNLQDYRGSIYDVAYYKGELLEADIQTIYNNGVKDFDHNDWAKSEDLILWWKMGNGKEDGEGRTIFDMNRKVVYGDNTIASGNNDRGMGGANNWDSYGTNAAESVTGGKLQVTTDTLAGFQGAQLPIANAGTPVIGRSYRIRAKLKRVSGLDPISVAAGYGGSTLAFMAAVDGSPSNGEITDTEEEYFLDVVAADATGNLIITSVPNAVAGVFEIDDVVIEEPQHYLHDGTLYGDASIVSID